MPSFAVDINSETYDSEQRSITEQNIRYNAEGMILHDCCSRYSGVEAVLHTTLEAKDGYIGRRLSGQSTQGREQELVVRTTSTSTFTLRTVTQGVRMLEIEINRITCELMDAFASQNRYA
jgi:hypothetical protein